MYRIVFLQPEPIRAGTISEGSRKRDKDGFSMPITDLTHARRGLSALELGLLAFSIAIIVAITLTL